MYVLQAYVEGECKGDSGRELSERVKVHKQVGSQDATGLVEPRGMQACISRLNAMVLQSKCIGRARRHTSPVARDTFRRGSSILTLQRTQLLGDYGR